eukprot:scaffold17831_cov70-Phaeocystis_antarctica.AAC.1
MESTPATRSESHTVGTCRGSKGRREDRRRASIFSVTLQRLGSGGKETAPLRLKVHGGGDGCGGLGAAAKAAVGCAAASAPLECMARSTGNHCGGHA